MRSESQKLSVIEKTGYGLGDAGTNFVFQTQIMFLMYFYTDVFGIPAAAVGTLFFVSRLWDALNDPLMGALADRTNTRWGKFRPWVLWTAVPFGLVFVLTFTTPDLGMKGKLIWAYTTYVALMMVYTANNIPYSALTGVLTGDSVERTSLASYRFICVMLAAVVIQGFVNDMVDVLGTDNQSIVHATLSGSTLTVHESGRGTAKLAITARDDHGHAASDTILVKVTAATPEVPVVKAEPENLVLDQGFGSHDVDLSTVFDAGAHGPLTFSATSNNPRVAATAVQGNVLSIREVGVGTAEISVGAVDQYGSQVRDLFSVAVLATGNAVPRSVSAPVVKLPAAFGKMRVPLQRLFVDDDGDELTYSVHGGNRAVVITAVDGNGLVLNESSPGLARLRVSASDGRGGVATLEIPVIVATGENMAPAAVAPPETVIRRAGFGSLSFDLASVFDDPDGDPLHYSVAVVNQARGFQRTVSFFAVLAVVFFFVTFLTTKERVQPDPDQRTSLKQDLKDLASNGPWVVLFVLTIFLFINLAMRGAISLYYFQYYLGRGDLFGWFNGIGLATTMIGIVSSKSLAARFGNRNTFRVCLSLTALFIFLFVFVPPNAIWLIFLLQILLQLSFGPTIPMLWAMMADVADYSEWKTGRRATGMTFSAATFGSKAGLGLGGAASGWLLAQYGYVPGVEQSEAALGGIVWMMSVWPAIAFAVGVLVLFFYRIDKRLNLQIQEELTERRRGFRQT